MATMKNELMNRYEELYELMAESKDPSKMQTFGEADRWAFQRVTEINPSMAEMWLSKLEPMMWDNYLSRAEADKVVALFKNADGTIGAHWPFEQFRQAVENVGGEMNDEPSYNNFALWVVANMLYSDHCKSVDAFVPKAEQVKFYYAQAIEKLTDADRKHFVREYFGFE